MVARAQAREQELAGAERRQSHYRTASQDGDMLPAVSRRVVRLYKERYGRGPTRAQTYNWRDLVVVLLRDGLTPIEETLRGSGRGNLVFHLRAELQHVMHEELERIAEEELRREVLAVMTASHHEPDVHAEIFLLAPERTGDATSVSLDGAAPEHDGSASPPSDGSSRPAPPPYS